MREDFSSALPGFSCFCFSVFCFTTSLVPLMVTECWPECQPSPLRHMDQGQHRLVSSCVSTEKEKTFPGSPQQSFPPVSLARMMPSSSSIHPQREWDPHCTLGSSRLSSGLGDGAPFLTLICRAAGRERREPSTESGLCHKEETGSSC